MRFLAREFSLPASTLSRNALPVAVAITALAVVLVCPADLRERTGIMLVDVVDQFLADRYPQIPVLGRVGAADQHPDLLVPLLALGHLDVLHPPVPVGVVFHQAAQLFA